MDRFPVHRPFSATLVTERRHNPIGLWSSFCPSGRWSRENRGRQYVTTQGTAGLDLAAAYVLVSGVCVVARSDTVIQIGSEPPGQFLLHHAPAGSVDILKRLDGTVSAAQLLHRYHADEQLWTELLVRLLNAQLLIAAADWSFPGPAAEPSLQPERDSLVHRHGVAVARRVIQARQDAVVVVRGSGRLATSVATALAVAGVGHVHQQPDRALRPADLAESAGPDRAGIRGARHADGRVRFRHRRPDPSRRRSTGGEPPPRGAERESARTGCTSPGRARRARRRRPTRALAGRRAHRPKNSAPGGHRRPASARW